MRTPVWFKSPLIREISLMLLLKAVVLYGIWYVFFSHPVVPSMIQGMDVNKVSSAIVGPVGPAQAAVPSNAKQSSGETR